MKRDVSLETQMQLDAVEGVMARHVRARLAQTGRVLVQGTPETTAKSIVKGWQPHNVVAFYVLAKGEGAFHSTGELARKVETSRTGLRSFWRRLRGTVVVVRPSDGGGVAESELALFRDGHEAFRSDAGLKLVLNASMLRFAEAKRITDSQMESTRVARDNYEGACVAQESDASKTDAERSAARQRIEEPRDERAIGSVHGLFDKRSGTDG